MAVVPASQVWGITSSSCHFTLVGHEKSVNCVEYYHGGDKPYLISGSDDRCVTRSTERKKKPRGTRRGSIPSFSPFAFSFFFLVLCSTVRIWDLQSRKCLKVLSGHTNNVSCVAFHPSLPLILTGAEVRPLCSIFGSLSRSLFLLPSPSFSHWYLASLPPKV